jgi:hypothetical protein
VRRLHVATLAALLAWPFAAWGGVELPPGFSAEVYVTGSGFDRAGARGLGGIPATSTLGVDADGILYLARTGRRYLGGDSEDLWPIYRIPVGGASVQPESEGQFLYGPPLPNPQVSMADDGHALYVTTFDRDRRVGVLYRLRNGRAAMVAGGSPAPGRPPELWQPEGVAADRTGHLYVADREAGAVVKLDRTGRVLERQWLRVGRPRLLAIDRDEHLWVGADALAEAPWLRGPGEVWRASPAGQAELILRGPVAAGMALGPEDHLFVADRAGARIVVVNARGGVAQFASFTGDDAPRALAFVPDTPETRRRGLAGDLLVVTIRRGAWPLNEVLRIRGPFAAWVRALRSP